MVITFASHARGLQFDPGRRHFAYVGTSLRHSHARPWKGATCISRPDAFLRTYEAVLRAAVFAVRASRRNPVPSYMYRRERVDTDAHAVSIGASYWYLSTPPAWPVESACRAGSTLATPHIGGTAQSGKYACGGVTGITTTAASSAQAGCVLLSHLERPAGQAWVRIGPHAWASLRRRDVYCPAAPRPAAPRRPPLPWLAPIHALQQERPTAGR